MRRNRYPWVAGVALATVALSAVFLWRMPEVSAWMWYASSGKPAMTTTAVALSPALRWFDNYYVVADLGEDAYGIGEPLYGQCNFSYLIVGSRRALLFDTGPGVRDIRPVIRALTALPIEALPSHLHFDHVGNLNLFDVALPDLPELRRQLQNGRFALGLYQYLGFVEGFSRPTFQVTRWIKPGSEIDLGGRHLTLLSAPGHTPESVVLLDHGANRLFAGDFIYPSAIYAFLPGANLRDYAASAQHVLKLLNANSVIYGGHGCDPPPNVEVPVLRRPDLAILEKALESATSQASVGRGWYPREITVNERMKLLAKYPWMSR